MVKPKLRVVKEFEGGEGINKGGEAKIEGGEGENDNNNNNNTKFQCTFDMYSKTLFI